MTSVVKKSTKYKYLNVVCTVNIGYSASVPKQQVNAPNLGIKWCPHCPNLSVYTCVTHPLVAVTNTAVPRSSISKQGLVMYLKVEENVVAFCIVGSLSTIVFGQPKKPTRKA